MHKWRYFSWQFLVQKNQLWSQWRKLITEIYVYISFAHRHFDGLVTTKPLPTAHNDNLMLTYHLSVMHYNSWVILFEWDCLFQNKLGFYLQVNWNSYYINILSPHVIGPLFPIFLEPNNRKPLTVLICKASFFPYRKPLIFLKHQCVSLAGANIEKVKRIDGRIEMESSIPIPIPELTPALVFPKGP